MNKNASPVLGSPLFPGEDEGDQLACILEVLGMPPERLLDQSRRMKHFFSTTYGCPRYCMEIDEENNVILRPRKTKRGKIRDIPGSKSLRSALKGREDPAFLDFLTQCLQWMPDDRITPREAFRHEWLKRRTPRVPVNISSVPRPSNTHDTNIDDVQGQLSMTVANSTTVSVSHAVAQRILPPTSKPDSHTFLGGESSIAVSGRLSPPQLSQYGISTMNSYITANQCQSTVTEVPSTYNPPNPLQTTQPPKIVTTQQSSTPTITDTDSSPCAGDKRRTETHFH